MESASPKHVPSLQLPFYIVLVAGLGLLIFNAAVTNVWDDETNGFFLSILPVHALMELMTGNIHEDPPLFDLILHFWQKLAGYHTLGLRMLPILFWAGTLVGIQKLGDLFGKQGAGRLCVIVALLMPYHWMFPAALRWYSFFACLAVWNTWLMFLLMRRLEGAAGRRELLYPFIGYTLLGSAMWYTNYAAPALFLAQGISVAFASTSRWRVLGILTASWFIIGLLYLPWLSIFFHQLTLSKAPFSINYTLASLYALWAGEVSTPYTWWISIPLLISALAVSAMILLRWKHTAAVSVLTLCILFILVGKNVIWTKRLLLVSPFLATSIGLALSNSSGTLRHRAYSRLRYAFYVAAGIVLAGSLYNTFHTHGWMTYRWLQPTQMVVSEIKKQHPEAMLWSNSNSVAFFAHDPVGINIAHHFPEKVDDMRVMSANRYESDSALKKIQHRLAEAKKVIYIHEASGAHYSETLPWLLDFVAPLGFKKVDERGYMEMSSEYMQFHPGLKAEMPMLDRYRLVVVTFTK